MKADNRKGSLAGKILRVNLSNRQILTEETYKYFRRFIGGRAINSYLLLNEIDPETQWSDPENMLIFGVGCLVGTLAPGACRVSVDTKSPFNGGKGSANFGGDFGPELKYAGFDHIVITGKAANPVYLWIQDGNVEIRDAGLIWGKTTYETETILREELVDDRVKIVSIGPAGENLVRGSCIVGECAKVAGGSGVGCVMGSKKLKAIAVRGHGSVNVARPERFIDEVNTAFAKIKGSPDTLPWRHSTIEANYQPESPSWDVTSDVIRNGQEGYWPIEKRRQLIGKDTGVPRYRKKVTACLSCPVGCMPFHEIEDGKYKGTRGTGYWVNSIWYSARLDVADPAASLKFHLLINQLGLDGDMTAVVLSWAFECYEKGLLTRQDTDGLELTWGNADAMIEMVTKIAYRKGIGNLLADGVKEASRKLGKGSERFAIHMKGQDSVDPYRIRKGFGLGISTSPAAGRHLRGAVGSSKFSGPRDINLQVTEYTNQPQAVFWQLQAEEIENITGTCLLMGSFCGAHALEPSDYARLVSAAMGIDLTGEEFMLIGRSSYNLEKAFNTIHAGFDRKDDYPPRRYMEEPVKSGPYAGYKCDKDKWDEMLDIFYELHGWNRETGWQTRRCLAELGMDDVAEKLEAAGRLIDSDAPKSWSK